MPFEKPDKKALKLMRISAALWAVGFLAIPALLLSFLFFKGQIGLAPAPVILGLFLSISLLYTLIFPMLRFKNYGYFIDDRIIKIKQGVFFKSEHLIPINRVHQIDIRQGPLDLLTGRAKLIVTTAGSAAEIKFLDPATAQNLADSLNGKLGKRLGQSAGDSRV